MYISAIYLVLGGEALWGALYALFLQHTKIGRYLAERQTWLSVVIGVGVTGLIAQPVLGWRIVGVVALCFACSSVAIITRSLINMARQWRELWDDVGRRRGES